MKGKTMTILVMALSLTLIIMGSIQLVISVNDMVAPAKQELIYGCDQWMTDLPEGKYNVVFTTNEVRIMDGVETVKIYTKTSTIK